MLETFLKSLSVLTGVPLENIVVYYRESNGKHTLIKTEGYFSYSKDEAGKAGYYIIYDNRHSSGFNKLGSIITSWRLGQLPGCCAIALSTGVYIAPEHRSKGVGDLCHKFRIEIAKYLDYSMLMCTDIDSNKAQRAILKKNGWADVADVVNKRTNNHVFVSTLKL
jgi:GNAT superfamily N-acetyltransferase